MHPRAYLPTYVRRRCPFLNYGIPNPLFHVACFVSRPEVSSVYVQGLDNVKDWGDDEDDDWMETVYM